MKRKNTSENNNKKRKPSWTNPCVYDSDEDSDFIDNTISDEENSRVSKSNKVIKRIEKRYCYENDNNSDDILTRVQNRKINEDDSDNTEDDPDYKDENEEEQEQENIVNDNIIDESDEELEEESELSNENVISDEEKEEAGGDTVEDNRDKSPEEIIETELENNPEEVRAAARMIDKVQGLLDNDYVKLLTQRNNTTREAIGLEDSLKQIKSDICRPLRLTPEDLESIITFLWKPMGDDQINKGIKNLKDIRDITITVQQENKFQDMLIMFESFFMCHVKYRRFHQIFPKDEMPSCFIATLIKNFYNINDDQWLMIQKYLIREKNINIFERDFKDLTKVNQLINICNDEERLAIFITQYREYRRISSDLDKCNAIARLQDRSIKDYHDRSESYNNAKTTI